MIATPRKDNVLFAHLLNCAGDGNAWFMLYVFVQTDTQELIVYLLGWVVTNCLSNILRPA